VNFEEVLRNEGLKIMKVSEQDGLKFMKNFLNLGDNQVISVNPNLEKR